MTTTTIAAAAVENVDETPEMKVYLLEGMLKTSVEKTPVFEKYSLTSVESEDSLCLFRRISKLKRA